MQIHREGDNMRKVNRIISIILCALGLLSVILPYTSANVYSRVIDYVIMVCAIIYFILLLATWLRTKGQGDGSCERE